MRAHPYACVINVSGPVCGAQRLNVSYDHLEVKRKERRLLVQMVRLGADNNVWLMSSIINQAAQNDEEQDGSGNLTDYISRS